jgi:hypothetical protein
VVDNAIPDKDGEYSIGTEEKRWKDIWLSGDINTKVERTAIYPPEDFPEGAVGTHEVVTSKYPDAIGVYNVTMSEGVGESLFREGSGWIGTIGHGTSAYSGGSQTVAGPWVELEIPVSSTMNKLYIECLSGQTSGRPKKIVVLGRYSEEYGPLGGTYDRVADLRGVPLEWDDEKDVGIKVVDLNMNTGFKFKSYRLVIVEGENGSSTVEIGSVRLAKRGTETRLTLKERIEEANAKADIYETDKIEKITDPELLLSKIRGVLVNRQGATQPSVDTKQVTEFVATRQSDLVGLLVETVKSLNSRLSELEAIQVNP